MHVATRAHILSRFQREGRGEAGRPAEGRPLVLVEQVVAPLDRSAQGALARLDVAPAAHQETEAVVETRRHLRERQRPEARRGQLDRERDAVERRADRGDVGDVVRRRREAR